jgi:hypothetical protein
MTGTSLRQVPCPDCGQVFTPRGLSGHRRQKHGQWPASALPARRDPTDQSISTIVEALAHLQATVERMEQQLVRLQEQKAQRETPNQEEARLSGELALLLERIGRVERARRSAAELASDPAVRAEFLTTAAALGRLRRDQARLIFRMDELRKGEPPEASFWK